MNTAATTVQINQCVAPSASTPTTSFAPAVMNSLKADPSHHIAPELMNATKTGLSRAGYAVPSDRMISAMHAALTNDSDVNKNSDRWLADAIRAIQGMGVRAKEIDATVEQFLIKYLKSDRGYNKTLNAFLCGEVEHPESKRYLRNSAGTQRVTVTYDRNWKAVRCA